MNNEKKCTGIFSRLMFRFCGIFFLALLLTSCNEHSDEIKSGKRHSTSTQPEREIKQYVLTTADDSVFHYSTMCSRLDSSPRISNEYVERKAGKWMCDECGIKEAEFLLHKEEYMNDLREADSLYVN